MPAQRAASIIVKGILVIRIGISLTKEGTMTSYLTHLIICLGSELVHVDGISNSLGILFLFSQMDMVVDGVIVGSQVKGWSLRF